MKLFLRQLWFELVKLFARKRTYLGFAAFPFVELLILSLMRLPKVSRILRHSMTQGGLDFSHYFSGLTMAYLMITNTVFLLGSLYLALVCGDMVAKEVEDGTMRMVLSRPISRFRVLLLKYLACVVYTWTLTLYIVMSSLALGILVRGFGGLIVVAMGEQIYGVFEAGPGLLRFAFGTGILGLVMLTLSTLGFMFSCFNIKPATATILTLSVYIINWVLNLIPYFTDIRGYFLTHHMAIWMQCFQQTIPWGRINSSVSILGAYDVIFLLIGGAYFFRRDFKS